MLARIEASKIYWIVGVCWFLFLTAAFFYYRGRTTVEIFLLLIFSALLVGGYELYRNLWKKIPSHEVLSRPAHISVVTYIGIVWATVVLAVISILTSIHAPGDPSLLVTYGNAARIIASIVGGWLLFALCWYSLGRRMLRWLRLDFVLTGAERGIYSLGMGLVACGVYFYFAALMSYLNVSALALFIVISFLCGLPFWSEIYRALTSKSLRIGFATSEPETNIQTALMLLLAFIVLAAFLNNGGYYLFRGDELRTYINVPATYIAHGGIVSFPYDLHNNSSNAFAFIYAPLLMLREDLPNFASLFFYIGTVLATGLVAYQIYGKRACLWAMFFVGSIPWSFAFLVGSKIDFMLTFIVVAGVAALLQAWRVKRNFSAVPLLAVSGLFIGFACMIKYSALLIVPVVVVLSFFGLSAWTMRERAVKIVFYGVCIGAIMFPWAMRSMLETGNPTYPYGSYRIGYFNELSPSALTTYEKFYDHKASLRQVLTTNNPWWKNVWIVIINQSAYPGNISGVLFFGVLPATVLFFGLDRQKRREWVALAAIVTTVFFAWLFTITLQLWYVMFIFPLWCVLYAPLVAETFPRKARVLLAFVLLIVFMERFSSVHLFLVQYYSGTVSKIEYNAMLGESNTIAEYLNTSLAQSDPNYLIMPISTKGFELLIADNHKHFFNYYYDPASYRVLSTWILLALKHERDEDIVVDIRSHGITHILYDQQDIDAFRPVWCYEGDGSELCMLYDRLTGRFKNIVPYLTVDHETPEWTIYRLSSS